MARRSGGIFSDMVSNFRRSWTVKRHIDQTPKVYIGQDENGNKYFQQDGDIEKDIKVRRWVEALNPDQTIVPRVPLQWDSWLRGRRDNPPTDEEVAAIAQRVQTGKRLADQGTKSNENKEQFTDPDKRVPFPKYKDLGVGKLGSHKPD